MPRKNKDATLNWNSGFIKLSPTEEGGKVVDPAKVAPGARGVSGVDARSFHRSNDTKGMKDCAMNTVIGDAKL